MEVIGLSHKLLIAQDLDSNNRGYQIMEYKPQDIAKDLFEVASEQRLEILLRLGEKKSTVSKIAKELGATVPEVFRNFERLIKAGLIEKSSDGNHHLTLYGTTVLAQIPSLVFVPQNRKYFKNHDFGNIPTKFIQRIGALNSAEHIRGVVKVLERWKEIHKNADEYIFNILTEVPYSIDIIEVVVAQAKKNVKIRSIFSDSTLIPKDRKDLFEKLGFKKFIEKGTIERKMKNEIQVIVLLNEKEGCIIFPKDSEVEMTEMLYSSDPLFHEWCLDYFTDSWETASTFQERKLS